MESQDEKNENFGQQVFAARLDKSSNLPTAASLRVSARSPILGPEVVVESLHNLDTDRADLDHTQFIVSVKRRLYQTVNPEKKKS